MQLTLSPLKRSEYSNQVYTILSETMKRLLRESRNSPNSPRKAPTICESSMTDGSKIYPSIKESQYGGYLHRCFRN